MTDKVVSKFILRFDRGDEQRDQVREGAFLKTLLDKPMKWEHYYPCQSKDKKEEDPKQ